MLRGTFHSRQAAQCHLEPWARGQHARWQPAQLTGTWERHGSARWERCSEGTAGSSAPRPCDSRIWKAGGSRHGVPGRPALARPGACGEGWVRGSLGSAGGGSGGRRGSCGSSTSVSRCWRFPRLRSRPRPRGLGRCSPAPGSPRPSGHGAARWRCPCPDPPRARHPPGPCPLVTQLCVSSRGVSRAPLGSQPNRREGGGCRVPGDTCPTRARSVTIDGSAPTGRRPPHHGAVTLPLVGQVLWVGRLRRATCPP